MNSTISSKPCPVCGQPVGTDYFVTPADRYAPHAGTIFNLYPHHACYGECVGDLAKYAEIQKRTNAQ